jgi:DNA-binding GntR family transcriptional regulator
LAYKAYNFGYSIQNPSEEVTVEKILEETKVAKNKSLREMVYESLRKTIELATRLPQGGYAVREFTREDVEEIFGIRSALESYAAYLAALYITPEKIVALEKKFQESENALKRGDDERAVQFHTEFHDLLYNSCKSKKLIGMINNFRDYSYRYWSALLRTEGGFRYSHESHRRMLEAIKKKNPRLVERLVRQHLARGKEIIIKEINAGRITP